MIEQKPFVTSIWLDMLSDVSSLSSDILKIKESSANLQRSNAGGWHSELYTQDTVQDFFADTLHLIKSKVNYVYNQHGFLREPKLDNYWFNVNEKYNYNVDHAHPFCIMSAVLFVKSPTNCGNLVLRRPDASIHYIRPDVDNERNYLTYWVRPEPNLLVVFPSHLFHYVEQNLTEDQDNTRISIALNFA